MNIGGNPSSQLRCATGVLLVVVLLAGALIVLPTDAGAAGSYCVKRSHEDLRVANISCRKGKKAYRASLMYCEDSPCSFDYAGRRWRCRAYNSRVYTWRCNSENRVVRYRWLAGE